MTKSNSRTLAETIFKGIKKKQYSTYNEKAHCISILQIMNSSLPYLSEFCRTNCIDRSTVVNWISSKPMFAECYNVGLQFAHSNWVREGEDMKDLEEFNSGYWKHKGKVLFQIGESRRLRLRVKKDDTPYEQYKSIMDSASDGEYTATELKLIMESVLVGARAYESDELAKRIDEIEGDVDRGHKHSEQNRATIEQST